MMRGPGPRGRGPMPKASFKGQGKTLKRLLRIVMSRYKWHLLAVTALIIISVLSSLQGTLFTRTLIDDYILPMLADKQAGIEPDFTPLAAAIGRLAIFLTIALCSSYGYNRIMVNVSQGSMLNIRTQLFTNMEKLPIKYFDTHAHGDIMSVYTNDVDTLRQLIGGTLPQVINSAITIVSVFVSMVTTSIPLTLLSLVMIAVMMVTAGKFSGKAGSYFMAQQKNLGAVNGYIEETVNGQKVIKVFNH